MAHRRDVRSEDHTPLLAEDGSVKDTSKPVVKQLNHRKASYGPDLPYGGKVYLPRKKLEDPSWVKMCEVGAILVTISFALYANFYFDNLNFNVNNGYAHIGVAAAQHEVGQRRRHGVGTGKKTHAAAMYWFKKAANKSHPHASYNLAIGHLKGMRTDLLDKGKAANKSHPHASYNLAIGHLKGMPTDLLEKGKAANKSHPHASYNLAIGHLKGMPTDLLDKGKAANKSHPHASYNLAIGHLKGMPTDLLDKGKPHRLFQHAVSQDVKEAQNCTKGRCE